MNDAQQGLTDADDNLPHGVPFYAPSPSLLGFGQRVSRVDHQLDSLHVQEVEEQVHVGTVGDVHEREVLLLGQGEGVYGACHESFCRRVQVNHEPRVR